jgi:Domain of unknown function (DUF4760)
MSLELVNTFATLGTFAVITATAIAAVIQLRHMRGSNQIVAMNELREARETPEFQLASQLIADLPVVMRDAAFRYQIANVSARTDENRPLIDKIGLVGNYYEAVGILVKAGLVEKSLVLDIWWANTVRDWERLAPVASILRRQGDEGVWENFEYLVFLAREWHAAHPKGTYPAGVPRLAHKDEWLEADQQYAASLAPRNQS